MNEINQKETLFIKKFQENGLRPDLRQNMEERNIKIIDSTIEQSDGHIELKKGKTHIEIAIKFVETQELLFYLNLEENNEKDYLLMRDNSTYLTSNVNDMLNYISNEITNFIKKYKIGINLELKVFNNDGNFFDLFFLGLKKIFTNLSIPIIEGCENDKISEILETLDIPISKTYAVFNDIFVLDPCSSEEQAADAIVHVFVNSKKKVCGLNIENSVLLDPLLLLEVINQSIIDIN